MKNLALALAAIAAFTGSAFAADLPARTYSKAPVMVAAPPSWTGCYVGAGGGGAITRNNNFDYQNVAANGLPAGAQASLNRTSGADGWLGTGQVGCDYQFSNFVVGVFGDYDFMSVKGNVSSFGTFSPFVGGSQKMDQQWAVGGRVGYVVLPQLLTYVSAGYTQAHWQSTNLSLFATPGVVSNNMPGFTKGGWFIGTGDEYALSFLPGLFWKTEYRYSQFDTANVPVYLGTSAVLSNNSVSNQFTEHSVRSELVYRFNWTGPVSAKY
jgi:outer membrane immunogenic protein